MQASVELETANPLLKLTHPAPRSHTGAQEREDERAQRLDQLRGLLARREDDRLRFPRQDDQSVEFGWALNPKPLFPRTHPLSHGSVRPKTPASPHIAHHCKSSVKTPPRRHSRPDRGAPRRRRRYRRVRRGRRARRQNAAPQGGRRLLRAIPADVHRGALAQARRRRAVRRALPSRGAVSEGALIEVCFER